jgi:4-hydroxyacetophenone monooxygenase
VVLVAVVESDRSELLAASDEEIEDAVQYAEPLVLRGLLYQLTGDEGLVALGLTRTTPRIGSGAFAIASPDDVALLRRKAADFLKAYRDGGAGPVGVGPLERLPHSLALVAGEELPEEDVELWLEEFALDRWARGLHWEQEPPAERLQDFSVVVIGAGMGGLNAAVQLKHAGIEFTVLEKNSGVGGTWWENRYPGARIDVPSRSYTHLFGVDFEYPNAFCPWTENQRYFDWVADEFGIRDHIVLDTEVKSIVWDEAAAEWEVTAGGPAGERVWRANAIFSAVGFLNRPNLPELEGMDEFDGPSFHTANWPEELELAGKRVAVVGTGCSGYQTAPEIAVEAAHVYVFQRTPQWLFPVDGYRSPLAPQALWLDRNLPYHTNFMRFRAMWGMGGHRATAAIANIDPTWHDEHTRSAGNKLTRDGCIEFLRSKLGDRPDLLEKMIPAHPPMSARPVIVDADYNIADALIRDNVTLVSDGIRAITDKGIVTNDGRELEVDVIVYATGFRADKYLWPMEVRGRGGRRLAELWAKDGPRAYKGVMLPGFPNLFVVYGPNTNPYNGSQVVTTEEIVTHFALSAIKQMILDGKHAVDVTPEAYWRYNALVDEWESRKIYSDPRSHNYFKNDLGRSPVNLGIPGNDFWRLLRAPDLEEVILS